MDLPQRESPKGKLVSLFVTCLVDLLFPETGLSVVKVLDSLGVELDFPLKQTCCGQPGFNAGYRHEARQVARSFLQVFESAQVIVTPSGSCAAMVRHEYPQLFRDEPRWEPVARRLASITWEFSEFLVDGLGIQDIQARLPAPQTLAIHDACHGMRLLGIGEQARTLLGNVENACIEVLPDHDICCGFGGLFSVKMADVSGEMLRKKIANIQACPADTVVTGDVSCLMHMNGGLKRSKSTKRVRHLADVLAEGL